MHSLCRQAIRLHQSYRTAHFIVIARDFTDSHAYQRRLAVRPQHLERALAAKQEGTIVMGGALLSQTQESKMEGSVMLLDVPSLQDAHDFVQADPYIQGKVWDKVEIIPFKLAGIGKTK